MNFETFLELLPNSILFNKNRHFRPQSAILADIELDFTGRFDCFSRDFDYVLNCIGLPDLKYAIPHKNKTANRRHYSQMFSNSYTRKLVADLYSGDVNRWGFEF